MRQDPFLVRLGGVDEIGKIWPAPWSGLLVLDQQARHREAYDGYSDTSVWVEQSLKLKLETRGDAKGPDMADDCRLGIASEALKASAGLPSVPAEAGAGALQEPQTISKRYALG